MRMIRHLALVAVLLACGAGYARAITVDGVLDPEYGTALVTQTTNSDHSCCAGMQLENELDVAHTLVQGDTLFLFLGGNLGRRLSEFLYFNMQLQLYFDTQAGGQNVLSSANPAVGDDDMLAGSAGLTFDPGFEPDFWLAGSRVYDDYRVFRAELPTAGGGEGSYLGAVAMGATDPLSGPGASNPFGIRAVFDDSNVGGVGTGCTAASGAGVTTGAEWAIPLAALGHPTGEIRVCAFLSHQGILVINQTLGPVPPGTCTYAQASTVNFADIPGDQFFVIDRTTPTQRSSWGRLKSMYR